LAAPLLSPIVGPGRNYHSVGILLPDDRVSGGGGLCLQGTCAKPLYQP